MQSSETITHKVYKNYDMIDFAKFVLSIMVVCIHVPFCPEILKPYLRIAVPIFFMISSFFIFKKINETTEPSTKKSILVRFVVRNLQLYLFYLLLFLPITWHKRNWFENGVFNSFLKLIQSFLFGSTFVASWYIMASILGTVIIFILAKKLNNSVLLTVTLLFYLICCVFSNYYNLFLPNMGQFMQQFESIFLSPYNNLFVSFFWIACGKLFAEIELSINKNIIYVVLFVSLSLLFGEAKMVSLLRCSRTDDCYVMLIPVCVSIFVLLLKTENILFKNVKTLRKLSTMIYASHGSIIPICRMLLSYTSFGTMDWILFLLTMTVCLCYCLIIIKLEKSPYFSWLRYAY